jgi:hypothetical protein
MLGLNAGFGPFSGARVLNFKQKIIIRENKEGVLTGH